MSGRANGVVLVGGAVVLALGALAVVGPRLWAPEPTPTELPAKVPVKGSIGAVAPSRESGLVMPPSKRCLAPPSGEGLEDGAMASSAGLSYEDVAGSMKTFLPTTLRCAPDGGIEGTVNAAITVGCDGRVSDVVVTDARGLPDDFVACVSETLKFAPFPAHDLPDGFQFDFPLTFAK